MTGDCHVRICEGLRVKLPGSTRSLLVCLSLNGKALADHPVPLPCDEYNYLEYVWSTEKTEKLIEETGKGCNLVGTDFMKVVGRWASTETYLEGADLRGADFRRANLTEAIFEGVDGFVGRWASSNLRGADFRGAIYDDKTMFPEGFDPVESGMRKAPEGDSGDN